MDWSCMLRESLVGCDVAESTNLIDIDYSGEYPASTEMAVSQ
jgi:hypothetical protein